MAQADADNLRKKAAAKLYNVRARDMEQHGRCDLSLEDLLELVAESTGKCPGCNCKLEFGEYKTACRYQWSPDRINRNVPHSKGNLRIVCWGCNTGGMGIRKGPCKNGCHPGDLPWGSSPVPAPEPEDVPVPTFTGHRLERCPAEAPAVAEVPAAAGPQESDVSEPPAPKRQRLEEAPPPQPLPTVSYAEGILEG